MVAVLALYSTQLRLGNMIFHIHSITIALHAFQADQYPAVQVFVYATRKLAMRMESHQLP
jgi:hypothetical protein